MATYVIGDIQGCLAQLEQLLAKIDFDPVHDILWLTGDLVNRGPHSLEVLRYIKSLGDHQVTVLGNHDLHLLAVAYGVQSMHAEDTLNAILSAPDKVELIEWLRYRPLLHFDSSLQFVMTHAGIAPTWSIELAAQLAQEVEVVLRSDRPEIFLKNMYGNQPACWDDQLQGMDRLRCIVNFLTRMRFCYADGSLDLSYKGEIANKPTDVIPWFSMPHRYEQTINIVFGHWAALGGKMIGPHLYPLDTGCVWGNCLTALCLENKKRFSVPC